jgi:anti-sigma B factor antagonist
MSEPDHYFAVEVDLDAVAGPCVRASGELDAYTSLDLRRAIEGVASAEAGVVRVDMSGVSFMDSFGLSTLLALARTLEGQGSQLVIIDPSDKVWKVIEMTGTDNRLEIRR